MKLVQLAYVSSAKTLFSKAELLELLDRCRTRNAALDVTGLLLYKDGNIMQVLEGDEPVIEALFSRVRSDPRHAGVIRLFCRPANARDFPDWTLAFHDLDDPDLFFLPGFSDLLNRPLSAQSVENEFSKAQELIKLFRANIR
jgi:hypothetical protein